MSVVALGLGTVFALLFAVIRRRRRELSTRYLHAMSQASSFEADVLDGVETIKAAGAERAALRGWYRCFSDVLEAGSALGDRSARSVSATSPLPTDRARPRFSAEPVSISPRAAWSRWPAPRKRASRPSPDWSRASTHPPTDGEVHIDGRDLGQLQMTSLRRQLGVVTQDAYLLGTTIRDNIALAQPDLPIG